jgi:hypothetical protein
MKNRFFIVVEAHSVDHVSHQANIAKECGADGIFLIDHTTKPASFLKNEIIENLLYTMPLDLMLGVNFLEADMTREVKLLHSQMDALWSSNSGIEYYTFPTPSNLTRLKYASETIHNLGPRKELFASTQFKWERKDLHSEDEIYQMCMYVDVLCTSGVRTNSTSAVEKIEKIRKQMVSKLHSSEEVRLAVCSGVDVENVEPFIGVGATDFLVKTSICKPLYTGSKVNVIDQEKATQLARKIKN